MLSQNSKLGSIQGQMVNIPPQNLGKLSILPVLILFFHLSLLKIWHVHPHKNFVFEINKDISISSPSLEP